jgi:hypothetical protein
MVSGDRGFIVSHIRHAESIPGFRCLTESLQKAFGPPSPSVFGPFFGMSDTMA